jgi:hypothetical protein
LPKLALKLAPEKLCILTDSHFFMLQSVSNNTYVTYATSKFLRSLFNAYTYLFQVHLGYSIPICFKYIWDTLSTSLLPTSLIN